MLVFFTNSSLMEFQVRYLLLFPHFWVIDHFRLCWMGILHKNIQLMLDFLKALFLAMHYYTLLTFLMILSRVSLHNEVLNFHSWILCYRQPFRDKIKIIRIINESVKFISYLNTELWWLCSFFLYWFFPQCPQSSQLILKNVIVKFPKNTIKPPLIWLMHLTL